MFNRKAKWVMFHEGILHHPVMLMASGGDKQQNIYEGCNYDWKGMVDGVGVRYPWYPQINEQTALLWDYREKTLSWSILNGNGKKLLKVGELHEVVDVISGVGHRFLQVGIVPSSRLECSYFKRHHIRPLPALQSHRRTLAQLPNCLNQKVLLHRESSTHQLKTERLRSYHANIISV